MGVLGIDADWRVCPYHMARIKHYGRVANTDVLELAGLSWDNSA